ncbi:bifunctional DNA primase/polymerase [Streptomyces sp. NPDC051940]|uniref:bifunctional DNA primase/polymerase n=1 Tax=Streptomyces sp. NPDC051940 TaxID=3155675 RepID=UPI00341A9AB2
MDGSASAHDPARPDAHPHPETRAHAHTDAQAHPHTDAHTQARTNALIAAARGLPVFPLSRAKQPAVPSPHRSEWPRIPCRGECGLIGHGVHDATTDPDAIRTLFAAAPWATGYGIACCRPPLLVIGIDLDVKTGNDSLAAFQTLADDHGFRVPATVTVLTPSGGRHLWLTNPSTARVPNSASRLAPGIDVRGTGGYLVGPGSLTLAGSYRLAPGSAQHPAPAPAPLLALLTEPLSRPDPPPPVTGAWDNRADALIRFVKDSRPGERNARLFWAACRAYESGHGEDTAQALIAAAVTTGLTPREATATVTSAARYHR